MDVGVYYKDVRTQITDEQYLEQLNRVESWASIVGAV